ncbi:MAG: helix-hairpin-helix domain-containing protein [Prevotellaceae bacterium]|jgi:competence ComEA-like helix-hairpin-helix protein|nr:helix-hairpin-helix domain-containing protein [Prevotellaceae bacterium]
MNRFLKDWMTFSKGERRGILALGALLLLLLLAPLFCRVFLRPKLSDGDLAQLRLYASRLGTAAQPQFDQLAESAVEKPPQPRGGQAFRFDPNAISADSLALLGFSPKQAAAIVRYRERGGRFRTAADFLKLGVITDRQRERLQAYVDVAPLPSRDFPRKDSALRFGAARAAVAEASQPVELNTADTALLRTLPGIGAHFAQKIVEYREQLGGYTSAEQLLEIKNFGHERMQRLANRVTVDASLVQRFALSEENLALMRRHPYLGAYTARGIAQYAKRKGSAATLDELLKNNLITSLQAERLRVYVGVAEN